MDNIIQHIPDDLKEWASGLSELDVAHILSIVGRAPSRLMDEKQMHDRHQEQMLDQTLAQTLGSANIGILGEQIISQILQEKYIVSNTAKTGHTGDFIITINGIRILIEVKKYTKTVPSTEVKKFYRDIDSNASIGGGIFISLTSKIVGIGKTMHYSHQYVNGEKVPIIFLSLQNMPHDIARNCIFASVDILTTEIEGRCTYIDIADNISHTVNNIDQNLDFLSQCRLSINETQTMFNKQLGKLMQNILSAEINIKNSVDVLKSKVDVLGICAKGSSDIKQVLLPFSLEENMYSMVTILLNAAVTAGNTIDVFNDVVRLSNKKLLVKMTKTTVMVSLQTILTSSLDIGEERWKYDGKTLSLKLTERTLSIILSFIEQW